MSPVRSFAAGISLALFTVLIFCLSAAPGLAAAPAPIVVTGPSNLIGDLHFNGAGGGWFSGQAPLGGTFVVGANGDVIVGAGYGSGVFEITPTGTQTVLAAFNNSNAAGIDQYGNVYVARDYGDTIIKIPYSATKGTYAGFTTLPTTNCQGGIQDTAACIFAPGTKAGIDAGATAGGGNPGFSSLLFDGQGNFFFATDTNPGAGGNLNTIYECSAQCQAETDGAGTYPPVVIYADPQAALGVVAIDPWGNLFFSDGQGNSSGNNSFVEELPFSSGKYASAPTVVATYTSSAGYNAISGVVASSATAIYFAIPNDGVYAIPNSSTGPNSAGVYKVSNEGGKGLTMDAAGNLYVVQYSGTLTNDGVFVTQMGNIRFAASPVGTAAATVAVTTIDNAADCTTPPALAYAASEGGASTTEFASTPATACSTAVNTGQGAFSPAPASNGSSFSATLKFTPSLAGERTAALVVTDAANSAVGAAALVGVGQGALPNLDPGVWTTYNSGFTAPASAIADAAGDIFIADSSAGKVYEIASGSTTPVAIGSGFISPRGLAFSATGNLFVADDGVPAVEKIINNSTTGGFTAGAQITVVSSTFTFGGTALKDAMGLAFGPDGRLYIADTGNSRVVTFDPSNGEQAVTNATASNGLAGPLGIAVDGTGNLFVADSSTNKICAFWVTGGITVAPEAFSQPSGIAVDASGAVLVANGGSGVIDRVFDLTSNGDIMSIESVPLQASSVWLDSAGNLYVASASGKSVYAIQRNAVAIDLGTVQDGLTNSSIVFLENAGNAAATLATPAATQPTNTMFTLTPASSDLLAGCVDGLTLNPGKWCGDSVTFAPLVGTANGLQTGTGSFNLSTPAISLTVNASGTATQSSILAQTITNFNPPTTMQVGQQTTLSATGGASGNPVVFSIDAASSCPACVSISGSTLTALATGTVIIDANQAGGQANGNQYAAAQTVKATIVISNNIVPAGVPALTMNQKNWLGALPNGGAFGGQTAAGTSFGVNSAGNVLIGTSYGGRVYLYDAHSNTFIQIGSYGNTGGVTLDSTGNLYVSGAGSGIIVKVPYAGGAYAALTDPTSGTAPANCTSSSTTECVVLSGISGIGGVASMTFDAQGDLFIATDDKGTSPHSIWECNAACLAGNGTPAPVMLFQEPTGSSPSTTGQLYVGSVAVDPWQNLFFTDSNFINQAGNNSNTSSYSDLYEIPYTSGSGYAATPTVLQTFTNKTPGAYDDELDSVVVASDGTLYYALQYDGVFAIPNTQAGGPVVTHQYGVSGQGAKEMALDTHGNVFFVSYNGGDALGQVLTSNNLTAPIAQLSGAPVTASANVIDNAFSCSTAATIAIVSSNPEFVATVGATCSGVSVSSGNGTLSTQVAVSSYPGTITFAATAGGPQTATLSLSDTTNGGTGTAKVTGTGQETPQTITFTTPTTTTVTYSPTLTITLGATGGGSNNPIVFTVDSSSSGAGAISGNTLTVTQAGTIVVDANQAGGLVNGIYYDNAAQAQLTLTISQASQTILFAPPASPVTYAPGLTVTLSATGGASGNPVTFSVDASSSGAGTISGNTLTVTQAGNIVVDANQASNVNYLAAAQVQQTLVVNKAPQTITFIPLSQPFHYIAGGATLAISATGGGSNDAIVFSVDTASTMTGSFSASTVSGSTSTAVLTLPAQTATSGTIVIDAMQPGNANYADSASTSETITILSPLPTQTITFPNPGTQVVGTPLTLTGTATSGFPVQYAAGPSTVCTVSGSTATFVAAGTCAILAMQPGDNIYFAAAAPVTQTFTVNPTGQIPAMNINLSLSSLSIQKGTVGLTQLNVTSSNNFTGTVNFACSGQPSGYNCAFNPASINVGPNATASTSLTISPSSTTAALHRNLRPIWPIAFGFAFCLLGFRKRNRLHLLLLAVVALFGLGLFTACGGSSGSTKTQTTSSTITVTATSGTMKSTTTLTVIVQ
ncbi:MAG TPA: NHL repeat-containing protein [Terracidiphilus sp.]|nr:NHL repeat-containing protein [Terracidiphilus sp.]